MSLKHFVCVVALSIGVAACNQTPEGGAPGNETTTTQTPAATTTPAADTAAPVEQVQAPAEPDARPAELPRTASPLPLLVLIGVLSLTGVAGIRFIRRS